MTSQTTQPSGGRCTTLVTCGALVNRSSAEARELEAQTADFRSTAESDVFFFFLSSSSCQSSSKALEQEVRERATVLQTEFENFVHADARSLQAAKKGNDAENVTRVRRTCCCFIG